jgi:hypothetical protein
MTSKGYPRSAWALVVAAAFLSLLFAGGAAAQTMPPGMTAVSGLYVNEEAGVEIEFPDGWEGFEISTQEALIVMTTMGQTSEKTIGLLIAAKTEVENPTDPNEFSQDTEMECGTPSVASTTVAGKSGQEVTVECTGDDGVARKMKMVVANTEQKWITVIYMAPTAEFAADEASFDATVQSLTVEGAIDTEGTGGLPGGDGGALIELTALTRTVVIAGAEVDIDIRTNSTIGELDLDEENKSVSFTVDGQTGTTGTTEISIGKMLEGPYTVTIDGQATTDFEVANEASAEAVMTITYTHSEHDVEVTGTNVVPEFPAIALGAIAAVIGIVAIIGRTRFMGLQRTP